MNTEADFVRAIAASPADEALALAFADWLEEHGDDRAAWVRNPAVRAWMGPTFADPVPALIHAVRRKKRLIAARRAAAAIGAPAAVPLAELLTHADAAVRLQVTRCLAGMKKAARGAVPALLAALKDADRGVRDQAAKALKDIGAKGAGGASQLRDALADDDPGVRRRAAEALGAMGATGAVIDELVLRLDDADTAVRRNAVESLGQLKDKKVVAPLCRALADADAAVRHAATGQLERVLGPGMTEAVPPLAAALRDPDPAVRRGAALALSRLELAAAAAAPALVKNLGDPDDRAREMAAYALGVVARGDDAVTAPLLQAAGDQSLEVSRIALTALVGWPSLPGDAASALVAAVRRHAPNRNDQASVLRVLARLPSLTPDLLQLLRESLRLPNERYVADYAGDVLFHFAPAGAEALPDLVAALRWHWPPHRPAWALAKMGEEGLAHLVALLDAPNEGTVMAALGGLLQAGPAAAVALPRLRTLLRLPPETSWPYINAAVGTLSGLGLAAVPAIPELLALLRDNRTMHIPQLHDTLRAITPALGPHVPQLAEMLCDYKVSGNRYLAPILARLSVHCGPAMEALRAGLRATAPAEADGAEAWDKAYMRAAIVNALAEAEPTAAIAELLPLLDEPGSGVSYAGEPASGVSHAAAVALGKLRAAEAVEPLRRLLGHKELALREAASTALGRIGPSSAAAVGELIVILSDAMPQARAAAAGALGEIGVATDATVTALRYAERDPDKAVARAAGAALKRLAVTPRPRPPRAAAAPASAPAPSDTPPARRRRAPPGGTG